MRTIKRRCRGRRTRKHQQGRRRFRKRTTTNKNILKRRGGVASWNVQGVLENDLYHFLDQIKYEENNQKTKMEDREKEECENISHGMIIQNENGDSTPIYTITSIVLDLKKQKTTYESFVKEVGNFETFAKNKLKIDEKQVSLFCHCVKILGFFVLKKTQETKDDSDSDDDE